MKLSIVLLNEWETFEVFFVEKEGRRFSFLQVQCTKMAELMSWEDGEKVNLWHLAVRSTCFVALPQLD